MKNRMFFLLYLVVLLLLYRNEFFVEHSNHGSNGMQTENAFESSFIDNTFNAYKKELNVTNSSNLLWNIAPEKKKVEKKVENKDNNKSVTKKPIVVKIKKRTICIEKECFRLIGVFFKKNHYWATFYSKSFKQNFQGGYIKTFKEAMSIFSEIQIKKITKQEILFKDTNSSRSWKIKLLDINLSKYRPKEFR